MKLVINIFDAFGETEFERLRLLKEAGFDGFFYYREGQSNLSALTTAAREMDLEFQSIHAPFGHVRDIWEDDEEKAELAIQEQIQCVKDCHEAGVDLMVAHAFIGFNDHTPTKTGLERFERIVKAAEDFSVKIAFENTEGIEYLDALMNHFRDAPNVGFCWDSGHEMCYNYSNDLLAKYGDRLLGTHLNDNLGISSRGEEITWKDDLHLLPFDGVADWKYNCGRLRKCGFEGPLTFELNITSKPGRHENDRYAQMTPQDYLAECHKRASLIGDLLLADKR